jgi:hypothetical protein
MPRSVVLGPHQYGGLNFRCLYTEQGCQQVELLIGHLRVQDTIGKMILATLSHHQLTAGVPLPLLEFPQQDLPHLDHGWIASICDFLRHINGSIRIMGNSPLTAPRNNDKILMEFFCRTFSNASQLKHLNHCRMYLQAITLSDICNGEGTSVLPEAYHGRPLTQSLSRWTWPRQIRPPASNWKIWQQSLRRLFLSPWTQSLSLTSSSKLGAWNHNLPMHHRHWYFLVQPSTGWLWHYNAATTTTTCHSPFPSSTHPPYRSLRHAHSELIPTPNDVVPATVTLTTSLTRICSAFPTTTPSVTTETTSNPNLPTATVDSLPLSFTEYLNDTVPQWERQLFFNLTQHSEDLCQHLNDSRLIIASNGSLESTQGSFGWVIGSSSSHYWTCSGPADGAPDCMSSQRTELYGILSALRFLRHVILFYKPKTHFT